MTFCLSRWVILLLALSPLLESCSGNSADNGSKPVNDTVVSENTMISLLADIHIIEAGLTMERNEGTLPEVRSNQIYQGLFRKYRITKSTYESSLKYYHSNPKEFSKLYAKVIERLKLEQEIVNRRR